MGLERSIDLVVEIVLKDLVAKGKKTNTSEEVACIRTISANCEKEIGLSIAETIQKVGNEGVITVQQISLMAALDAVVTGVMSSALLKNAQVRPGRKGGSGRSS